MRKGQMRARLSKLEGSPYFTLAQHLQEGVAERLEGIPDDDTGALAEAVDAEFAETAQTVYRNELLRRLGGLSNVKALELLRDRLGDEGADELLRQRAEKAKEFMRDNAHVETMRAQGAAIGSVDLQLTQTNDRLTIGLFDADTRESDFHPGSRRIEEEIHLRRAKQGDDEISRGALFDVLRSVELKLDHGRQELSSHNLVAIGGSRTLDREAIDPTLTYGSGLGGWRTQAGSPFFTAHIIGYATLNGITVLEQGMTPDTV